jgi:membrane protein DedA with SNARE-associated domain
VPSASIHPRNRDFENPVFDALHTAVQTVVEFVRAHEAWAAPVVFALAFGESLAFISLLLPAWAALVGIGMMIGTGGLKFWPIWIAGALGAAFGDWLSFWVGIMLGPPIARVWPL